MSINSLNSVLSSSGNRGVHTAISLVVDRSGSMSEYATDVIKSVTNFIEEQTKIKGKASLALSQFDHGYDVIYQNEDIKSVSASKFQDMYYPSGSTSLYDAIIQAALDMETHLQKLEAKDKPKRVVIQVITDGEDNTSKNTREKVRQLIEMKQQLGWDFMLFGVGQNTIELAETLGIEKTKTAVYSIDNIDESIKLLSQKVSAARSGKKLEITQAERQALLGKQEL